MCFLCRYSGELMGEAEADGAKIGVLGRKHIHAEAHALRTAASVGESAVTTLFNLFHAYCAILGLH